MEQIKQLLEGNKAWTEATRAEDPDFFTRLAKGQKPEYLWIGCSDSRVPATQITGTDPGSIFVHRNIANVVVHSDVNLLSVVYYAVRVLKVRHVVVCGHYGCGGVQAVVEEHDHGFLDNWLRHIKDVYFLHADELNAIADPIQRGRRLAELNVIEQARNVAKISFVQDLWDEGLEHPYIHGWIYSLDDGRLKDLGTTINKGTELEPMFRFRRD